MSAKRAAVTWAWPDRRHLRSCLIACVALFVISLLCASAFSGYAAYIFRGDLVLGSGARNARTDVTPRLEDGGAKSSGEHGRRAPCEGGCSTDDADRWWLVRFLRKNPFLLIARGEKLDSESADDSAPEDRSSSAEGDHLKGLEALEVAGTTRGGGRGQSWWFPGRRAQRKRNISRAQERAATKRAATKRSSAGGGENEKSGLPTGLMNQGNTCYLNSLLQSVYHAPGLKEAVFEAAEAAEGGATVSALAKVLRELDEGGRPASTLPLTEAMGLDPRVQQDAQEFGRFLFMELETECEGGPDEKEEGPDQGRGSNNRRSEGKKVLRKRIHEIFGGRLENYIECVDVPFSKEGGEVFYDLPLDVKGSGTLEKALDRFTEAELLAGDNMWRAGEHGLQRARKGVRFVEFPGVLQFHLKRFEYDPFRDDLSKINDRFEFPADLDVFPWLRDSPASSSAAESSLTTSTEHCDAGGSKGSDRSRRYRLSAVVMHAGTPTFGHYYAYVRHLKAAPSGSTDPGAGASSQTGVGDADEASWVKLDDHRVTEVSEDEVMRDAFGGRGGSRGGGRKDSVAGLSDLLAGQVGGVPSDGSTASAYMLQYVRDDTPSVLPPSRPSDRAGQASESPQP